MYTSGAEKFWIKMLFPRQFSHARYGGNPSFKSIHTYIYCLTLSKTWTIECLPLNRLPYRHGLQEQGEENFSNLFKSKPLMATGTTMTTIKRRNLDLNFPIFVPCRRLAAENFCERALHTRAEWANSWINARFHFSEFQINSICYWNHQDHPTALSNQAINL